MSVLKPIALKIPCIGEFTICKKNEHQTPFGILKGEELEDA